MNQLFKKIVAALEENKIRPSFQRIKVLEYLYNNQHHPNVDQIYKGLQNAVPTLSKATIYNTLNLFVKAGLVKVLTIEDKETRYDIITETHGHFKCEECGTIFNFEIISDLVAADQLAGFKVVDRSVYFKGVCSKCLLDMNNKQRREQIL
jgi:Fur family transcriptional regulator, peroxide stress response regulator